MVEIVNDKYVDFIKVIANYSIDKGAVSDSLFELLHRGFLKKNIVVNFEILQNGVIIFFKDYIEELHDFMKCQFIFSESNTFENEMYNSIYFSTLDKLYYGPYIENGFVNFVSNLLNLLECVNNLEEFKSILRTQITDCSQIIEIIH